MNLQERIDFILNKNFPAIVKRKHLVYLMKHLGEYSEDADELGAAHANICEALEQLDIEIGQDKVMERFAKSYFGKVPGKTNVTVTELDNESDTSNRIEFRILPRGSGKQAYIEEMIKQPLTVTELDRTLEFFLTYNILSMQQVQEIRTKAAAYLR